MPLVGFEPTISTGERPKTYALDRAAVGTGAFSVLFYLNKPYILTQLDPNPLKVQQPKHKQTHLPDCIPFCHFRKPDASLVYLRNIFKRPDSLAPPQPKSKLPESKVSCNPETNKILPL